jgi:hypothetical protein
MTAPAAAIDTERAALEAGLRRRLARVAAVDGGPLPWLDRAPGGSAPLIGRVADGDPLCRAEEAAAREAPAALLRALGALALLADSRRVALAVREDSDDLLATLRQLASGTRVEVVAVPARYPRDDDSLRCDVAAALDRLPAAFDAAPIFDAVVLRDIAAALDDGPPTGALGQRGWRRRPPHDPSAAPRLQRRGRAGGRRRTRAGELERGLGGL